MKSAFWDASALVPLCVEEKTSSSLRRLLLDYEIAVWWSTPVEIRSALERLSRMGAVSILELSGAKERLAKIRLRWREVQPSDGLRANAESFLTRYTLRAADALQFAAAWSWASGNPRGRVFISGDSKLLEAASQVGFEIVAAYLKGEAGG